MSAFVYMLASVFAISALSLVGVISLAIGRERLKSFLVLFVAFASGTLLSAAFQAIPHEHSHDEDEGHEHHELEISVQAQKPSPSVYAE